MNDVDIQKRLEAPFPAEVLEFLPLGRSFQTRNGETKIAVAAYVDKAHYQARLDAVLGVDGWSVEYRELRSGVVVARLTAHFPSRTVVREDVGEAEVGGENAATTAVAQAFKRACAALGVGRYLYTLPRKTVAYDEQRKQLLIDPIQLARELYAQAGLMTHDDLNSLIARVRSLIDELRTLGIDPPRVTAAMLRERGRAYCQQLINDLQAQRDAALAGKGG